MANITEKIFGWLLNEDSKPSLEELDSETDDFSAGSGEMIDRGIFDFEGTFAPFTERDYGERYFGGQPGPDIADPLDLAASSAASIYNIGKSAVVDPLINVGRHLGVALQKLSGEPLKSQEDFEKFIDEYDPEGIIKKEHASSNLYGSPVAKYHESPYDEWAANYFIGKPLYRQPSINIAPHKIQKPWFGADWVFEGVEPITAAEEVTHAKRHYTKAPGYKIEEGKGPTIAYLTRLREETLAKGTALKDVAKHEGLLEAILSVPGTLSTWATYALPHQRKVGRINQAPGYGRFTDTAIEYLDILNKLGYDNIGDFEKDYGIVRGKDETWESKGTNVVPKKVFDLFGEDTEMTDDEGTKSYTKDFYKESMLDKLDQVEEIRDEMEANPFSPANITNWLKRYTKEPYKD